MAELVDFLPPGLVPRQEGLVGLQHLLLVVLQYLRSFLLLYRVGNFGKIENFQKLVQLHISQYLGMFLFCVSGRCFDCGEEEK